MNILIISGDRKSLEADRKRLAVIYHNGNTFRYIHVVRERSCRDIETKEEVGFGKLYEGFDYIFFGDLILNFGEALLSVWKSNGFDEANTPIISYAKNQPHYLDKWTGHNDFDLSTYIHELFVGNMR